MKKTSKTAITMKVGILFFTVYAVYTLISLQFQIQAKKSEQEDIKNSIEEQSLRNAEISSVIENADDPEYIAKIAREKLGYVTPGEKVFVNISK